LSLATLEILIIGLVLGLIRNRTSTTVAILVHAGYNTLGVLLEML
jgi:membrane protease YdiL (CAAX protease family)